MTNAPNNFTYETTCLNILLQDIQTFIDEAPHGVVYFSLGTMIRTESFSPEILGAFISAFAQLPFRVMWKANVDKMAAVPNNIFIRSWLPQKDILGNQSIIDAIYN